MKQALEALEKLWDIIDDIDTYGDMAKSDDKLYRSLVERRQRQRFEQTGISTDGYELNGGAITALRQAIAGAEDKDADQWYENLLWGRQEPVAWAEITKDYVAVCNESFENAIPLYATPPKREWVGLTDEEAWKCWDWEDFQGTWKSIEAKLKEKNT
jgi:hypothetical protein